jgi:RimJ/RimL family protein N-acetyltransferase
MALLLEQVSTRPLHARIARTNAASLRVLEKCGFQITGYEQTPATERYPACEEAILVLK